MSSKKSASDVVKLNSYAALQSFIKSNDKCIVDYWATRCTPCRDFEETYNRLSMDNRWKGRVRFASLNVEAVKKDTDIIIDTQQLTGYPTFITYRGGARIGVYEYPNETGVIELLQAL